MGSTGNLPPGVFSVNFAVEETTSTSGAWVIVYNLSSTENMVVTINTVDTAPSPPLQPGQVGTFLPQAAGIALPASQNVGGQIPATAGVYNVYVQQTGPVPGPNVEVWTGLVVPPPVTGQGEGDGLGFGAGTPSFPPGHRPVWAHNLPVGEPIAGEPVKPNA